MRRRHVHAHEREEAQEHDDAAALPVHEWFDAHPQLHVKKRPETSEIRRGCARRPDCLLVALVVAVLHLASGDDRPPDRHAAPLGAVPDEEEEEEELVQPMQIHLHLLIERFLLLLPLDGEARQLLLEGRRERRLQVRPPNVLPLPVLRVNALLPADVP